MLDIYLSKRPLGEDVDLDGLAKRLERFSGADIKYICDRAAVVPFLKSVASGQEGDITQAVIEDVLADTRPSVTTDQLKRFEDWGQAAQRA
jgi:transitional endoplasmic reticulum ATPase